MEQLDDPPIPGSLNTPQELGLLELHVTMEQAAKNTFVSSSETTISGFTPTTTIQALKLALLPETRFQSTDEFVVIFSQCVLHDGTIGSHAIMDGAAITVSPSPFSNFQYKPNHIDETPSTTLRVFPHEEVCFVPTWDRNMILTEQSEPNRFVVEGKLPTGLTMEPRSGIITGKTSKVYRERQVRIRAILSAQGEEVGTAGERDPV